MDSKQLEQLFRGYRGSVYRRARAILWDKDSAQDVTQEVFLKVMQEREDFLKVESPMAWLYRVTTNLCLKRIRDSARRMRILAERAASAPRPKDPAVDAALMAHEMLAMVPEELQEIAVYYYLDRMSQQEISDLLSIPRRTVSYRLEQFRAAALSREEHISQ
jgi:RNA polymerase sigma-70 factor (ECF subfamily)